MSFEIWLYYLFAVLILTASPGPSSLLCMTKGVTHGWSSGFFTALGSLSAITIILTLSFTGLGVIVASSELVFNIIKYIGAIYLIYLGFKAITSKQEDYEIQNIQKNNSKNFKSNYLSGFIVGASNPKAILFFTALFPQFISLSEPLLVQYMIFVFIFICLELSWLMFYAYLGNRSSNWLLSKGRAKFFNRLSGSVFVCAGAFLSTTNRN